jgi:hypothetical protein
MESHAAYEAWNEALAERYYPRTNWGRPAYLSLDDDELDEIEPAGAEPGAESLSNAVRTTLGTGDSRFAWHILARDRWRENEQGYPPYIGLLGLCVLAASRMARDSQRGIESNAYYPQLNLLLGRGTFAGMPSGFEVVGSLWKDLCRWLDSHDGAYGTSTARQHSFFIHVGWPMSQCLLRRADRHRLTEFFRAVGLDPHEEIDPGQLWVLFKAWARPGCGLSNTTLRIAGHATGPIAEQFADILGREYAAWEGELLDRHGRRRGLIALTVSMLAGGRRIQLGLSPRRADGLPAVAALSDHAARPYQVTAVSDDWYAPLQVPVSGGILTNGLNLDGEGFSFTYEASDIVPLRASLGAAAWVSVRQAELFEEHCVLFSASRRQAVRDFLTAHAEHGWSETQAQTLPSGWHVIRGVRFAHAIPDAPPGLAALAPRLHTATRIAGGLQVAPALYLTQGEPDVWISVAGGDLATVRLDGSEMRVDGALELRLSALKPPLEEGQHQLVAGGITRHFATSPGFPVTAAPGTGAYGHVFERHTSYRPKSVDAAKLERKPPPRGTVYVSGASVIGDEADLPEPVAEPALIPNGLADYVVLGSSPHEVLHPITADKPRWIGLLVNAPAQFFDCPVPFAPQWVIGRGATGLQVRPLAASPLPPDLGGVSPGEAVPSAWSSAILRAAGAGARPLHHSAVWDAYVRAASALREERDGANI